MNDAAPTRASRAATPDFVWTADMVRPLADQGVGTPAVFLRKAFEISKPSGAETLRISALGLYRAFINGARVGNDLLTPGWTSYDKRLSYQTYAVGPLLKPGINIIDIWLGDGWYRSQMMWGKNPIFNTWGTELAAIAELRAAGIDARGPLAADAMFHAAARRGYDAALCMYHDQALIPVKTLDFDGAVNVTLGLPFIRTSPDHGTAFDIAGQGIARPDSLIAALRLAADMAEKRARPR